MSIYKIIERRLKTPFLALTWISAACVAIFMAATGIYGDSADKLLSTTDAKLFLFAQVGISIVISSVIICVIISISSGYIFGTRIKEIDEISATLKKSDKKLSEVALRMEKASEALLDNTWFLSSEEFGNREREILTEKDSVVVFVVSDTLSFDVDTELFDIVKENLKHGVNYRYIVKTGLDYEKDLIRKNALDARKEFKATAQHSNCGDVKFCEVRESHLILAFDYAIFAFNDRGAKSYSPKTEVYVALESGVDPRVAPWMRLDGDARKMVAKFVNSIESHRWSD